MKKVGRYNIIGELGRGAMSVVYKAQDPTIGRQVALKVISFAAATAEGMQSPQDLFMREVRAAGRLTHPSIVTIHDAFEDAPLKSSCIVMELVEGKTLENILMSGQRMTIEETLNIVRQVGEGLNYAHRNQVVHRDLKPANILVTPNGRIKITDFSIAKVLAREGVGRTIGMMGTPSYMSPEQVKGGDIDGRADLFSLGIITYLMLTGQKPFLGDTAAVMFKVVYEDPPLPSSLNLQLTHPYDVVVMKCLAKDRNQRYPSVRDFLNDLDKLPPTRPPKPQIGCPPVADGILELTMPTLSETWPEGLVNASGPACVPTTVQATTQPPSSAIVAGGAALTGPCSTPSIGEVPASDGTLELTLPILSRAWSEDLAKKPVSPAAPALPTPSVPIVPAKARKPATEIPGLPKTAVNRVPMVLGGIAILLLAATGVGIWKYHQLMTAQVPAVQIVLLPPPSVPSDWQPPQPVAPSPSEKKLVAHKTSKIAKAKTSVPEVRPAPPSPVPVATSIPDLPPSPRNGEETAQASASKLASVPRVVQVHCNTDLKEATYTISASGQTLFQTPLRGKKRGGFLGIKGAYEGTFSRTVTVPPGVTDVSVHVVTKDGATDLSRVISMPPTGGFVPTLKVGVGNNRLSLVWEGSSGPKM